MPEPKDAERTTVVLCAPMADDDKSHREEAKSDADRTLLGVAPPRIESSAETLQRAPVFVRSGTSVSEIEPPPLSRPVSSSPPPSAAAPSLEAAAPSLAGHASADSEARDRWLRLARERPVLWMIVAPVVFAVFAVWLGQRGHASRSRLPVNSAAIAERVDPPAPGKAESSTSIAELEAKPPESLSSRELVLVAEARSEQRRADARALRRKLEDNPTLAKDSAVQSELLRLAADDRTARDALAAMVALEPPFGADLLYEAWTRTPERSDTTELARALAYSPDVRPKASPGLAVALELRVAETCEQYKAILPSALKDGDRRSLPLLSKLNAKRGCGPQKSADCFACLREPKDELTATINAVKSRHAPSYPAH